MPPAKPPFPTPLNLPFQGVPPVASGNQTSKLIAGVTTPITRQKGTETMAEPKVPPGDVQGSSVPVINWAVVIVVSVSWRAVRLSHEALEALDGKDPAALIKDV